MEIMKDTYLEQDRYTAAQRRVKDIKGFYIHLVVYILVNLVLLFMNIENERFFDSLLNLSNYYTALFWGIGLAAHWASVFGPNFILGKKWEEKKIKELMEQEMEEKRKWE